MSGPTPLFDFFRRGEVARDVRLLAAQGALAPRAGEQLAILVCLLEDPDAEIRQAADATVDKIPIEVLQACLARSDIQAGLREFFASRGVCPGDRPSDDVDGPLIDTEPDAVVEKASPAPQSVVEQVAQMGFSQRLKAAVKGSREMRAILIRDSNKMIAASVLSSPKVSPSEVEGYARMANVSEDVLRIIAANRAWTKHYAVVLGLTRNPKTPVALSLNLMPRLHGRDLIALSVDRNIAEPLRIAARKRMIATTSGRHDS